MAKNYYRSGSNNLTCDVCGKKIKADESRKRWDGFQVCKDDWEERQPQDFVKAHADRISVPVTRPAAPTPFNIPIGWLEHIRLLENSVVTRILAPLDIVEILPVSDVFKIYRAVATIEYLKLQETVDFLVFTERSFTENLTLADSGGACFLDYVDPTYFAEIYVGTCTFFSP